MTYQITFYSPSGHAEKLAEQLRTLLPPDTVVAPLSKDMDIGAEVHLVGFDLKMLDLRTLPLNVESHLKRLAGKTIFLFATVPFQPNDVLMSQIHKTVAAALPAECDYRGLYLCPAQPPERMLTGFQGVVERHPDNTRARHWLYRCQRAANRPGEGDIQELCGFARHVLKTDS